MNQRDRMILQALRDQDEKLDEIRSGQSWWLDLSSNVAGNAIWDGAIWLVTKILRRL